MNIIMNFVNYIKRKYIFLYVSIILALNIWIYMTARYIIGDLFPNSVIAMRFNMFQGTTIINQSSNLNSYIWIALIFSFINISCAAIVRIKVFINKLAQHFILNWIFISNILVLFIIRYYFYIVVIINS